MTIGREPTKTNAAKTHQSSGPLFVALTAFRLALLIVVAAAVAITRFGTRWPSIYYMTGPSMEPTLAPNEYFLAWSPPDRIERGHLVLFRFVDGGEEFDVLRRVAALPGDTVAMDSGRVVLNGVPQRTPFRILQPAVFRSPLAIENDLYNWGPWIVPADSVVLLSDTRDMVGWPDSRFVGFVPLDDVIARATRTLRGRRLP